jgi:hypothetical protein
MRSRVTRLGSTRVLMIVLALPLGAGALPPAAALGTTAEVGAPTAVSARTCRSFVVFRGSDSIIGSFQYVASRVRRKGRVSCRRVRYMLRGTYYLDRGHVRRHRVGRASVFYRGGWECSNGAGGAGCSNHRHPSWSISANVGFPNG